MSYAREMLCSGEWCGNGQRFATEDEAKKSAMYLMMRWFVPTDFRVVESTDPVNYRWDADHGDVAL